MRLNAFRHYDIAQLVYVFGMHVALQAVMLHVKLLRQ